MVFSEKGRLALRVGGSFPQAGDMDDSKGGGEATGAGLDVSCSTPHSLFLCWVESSETLRLGLGILS